MPPRIDMTNPHAAKARATADHLSAEGVDPAQIQAIVDLILKGLPEVLAVWKVLHSLIHKPRPTPTPAP